MCQVLPSASAVSPVCPPSHSLPLPPAPSHFFFPCSTSSFLFFHYVLHNVGVFSHNITHFDHLILKYLSSPYTSHVSLILLTPRASEIILINGEGVNGVFKEHSIYTSAASRIHCCWYRYWFQIILVHKICNWKFIQHSKNRAFSLVERKNKSTNGSSLAMAPQPLSQIVE